MQELILILTLKQRDDDDSSHPCRARQCVLSRPKLQAAKLHIKVRDLQTLARGEGGLSYYSKGQVWIITSQTFLATRLSSVDPAVRLDNLSNLAVGRLVGLQHSSVIIYLVVIVFGQIRRQCLRECVIILKWENSFIVRFSIKNAWSLNALIEGVSTKLYDVLLSQTTAWLEITTELTKTKQLYLFCLFARDRTELIQCEVGFLPSCYLPVLLNERDFFWLSSECF